MTTSTNGNGTGFMGPDIIETVDEEGQVQIFEKIDEYEIDGERYALLIHQNDEDEEDEADDKEDEGYEETVIVMKIITEGEEEVLEALNDDEFDKVVKYIEENSDEDSGFDFVVDEDDDDDAED